MLVVRKILQTKFLASKELNKVDQCLYQIVYLWLIKNKETSELLSKLEIKTPLSKISLIGNTLF